jgi:putative membrane protein insertion efficiency factor
MITLAARMLRGMVRGYRYVLAPLLPPACRFHPSCSAYAEEALQEHGAVRGSWLTARRICRCGPWTAGGYDPVPSVRPPVNPQWQGQR